MIFVFLQHFVNWPATSPLCVHAESNTCAAAILVADLHNRPVHICHVSLREEIELIKAAKMKVGYTRSRYAYTFQILYLTRIN